VSDDQLRDRLDESIATVLRVSDKWVSDHRGPSASWVQALANITVTLLHARALIPSAALSEGETA
jgi:type IV secretory pathway TrbL component